MTAHRLAYDLGKIPLGVDPGDGGSFDTLGRSLIRYELASAAIETRTLAAPIKTGDIVTFFMQTDGGDIVITVTGGYDQAGSTTITFQDVGDYISLISATNAAGTYVWRVLGFDGVTGPTIEFAVADVDTLTIDSTISAGTSTIVRTSQEYIINTVGMVGATGGWVITGSDVGSYTLPASQTASTLVIPVTGIKVGWTITGFKVVGQIESAGNTATLDADLRKLTTAAGDLTDASVGAITQISVTADTAVATEKTALAEVVAATESFYVLLTGTTAASTDIDLQGITVTVTEA